MRSKSPVKKAKLPTQIYNSLNKNTFGFVFKVSIKTVDFNFLWTRSRRENYYLKVKLSRIKDNITTTNNSI